MLQDTFKAVDRLTCIHFPLGNESLDVSLRGRGYGGRPRAPRVTSSSSFSETVSKPIDQTRTTPGGNREEAAEREASQREPSLVAAFFTAAGGAEKGLVSVLKEGATGTGSRASRAYAFPLWCRAAQISLVYEGTPAL
ncbi:hypothetical protein MHYP_G00111640 [Metynnis hypsauchen]